MRSTFNILFYINRSKLRTDGTTVVLCRITIDGSKVVMSTGESISPKDWRVKRQETNDKKLNQRLQSFREKIEQGYNTLLLRPLQWSFSMIIVSISSEKAMPYRQQNKLSFG